jgi:hypothetical protein
MRKIRNHIELLSENIKGRKHCGDKAKITV